MPISPADWVSPDTHGWTLHPQTDADWEQLIEDYGGHMPAPLRQIVKVVRSHRCQTVVVENRYVDSDWRSEYTAYWAGRFRPPPPFARRLHFFRARLTDDQLHRLPARHGYVGYAVIRPVSNGPVGRSVIARPPYLKDAVLCTVTDEVSFFGTPLQVEGLPFCQQDTQFLRCAHAASWIAHYTAYRRGLLGRRSTGAIFGLAPKHLSAERALPSGGISPRQMQAIFDALDEPAILYSVNALPGGEYDPPGTPSLDDEGTELPRGRWDRRIFSVVCRYLNSGYPVIAAGEKHAWVLSGWMWRRGEIRFIASDDQRGPYEVVDSPFPTVARRGRPSWFRSRRRCSSAARAPRSTPTSGFGTSVARGLRARCMCWPTA
jgi:hypothetical protein